METPLITETNPVLGGTSVLRGGAKGKQYHKRSDAIAYGDRYQKAAALVDLVSFLSTCAYLRACCVID